MNASERREHDARNEAQLRKLIAELLAPTEFAKLPPRAQEIARAIAVRLGMVPSSWAGYLDAGRAPDALPTGAAMTQQRTDARESLWISDKRAVAVTVLATTRDGRTVLVYGATLLLSTRFPYAVAQHEPGAGLCIDAVFVNRDDATRWMLDRSVAPSVRVPARL